MLQLAGAVTADQLRAMVLEEEAVAVTPVGVEGTTLQLLLELLRTSMPITSGWLAPPRVKAITIFPLLLAVAVKVLTKAALAPTVA
jgi:hypothetical protein